MIHYHGTPITPKQELLRMSGRHFCVSFAEPRDLNDCLEIGQSVMLDNGAYTAYTKGARLNVKGFCEWVDACLQHPHWAVIPDVIDGDVSAQRELIACWPFPKDLSAPVFHIALPTDWLLELADSYPRICIGSSGPYWQVGSKSWCRRMDEVFEALTKKRRYLPWLHGMRMLGQSGSRFPLASADSTNVARNYKTRRVSPDVMAERIDAVQPQRRWKRAPQLEIEMF
jgi:hypothetical protein